MKCIELSRGLVAIVDDEDFERLAQWNWHANAQGYAVRSSDGTIGKPTKIRMHHEVLNTEVGKIQIDHINGSKVDNRKCNLRFATPSQNAMNRRTKIGKLLPKGVSYHKKAGRFIAQIMLNGKNKYLGLFNSPQEAKSAYDDAALEMFKEFARLN